MSPGAEILHPVAISQVMIHFAAGHGVSEETCLLGTGIEPERLLDAEALITRDQEMRLVENLMLALPDVPALGFRLGLQYNVATFGIWGFALRTSRTLHDALRLALRYLPLSTAYCRIGMLEADDVLGIRMDPDEIPRHLRQFLLERDMATAIHLIRELSLTGLHVQALQLQIPEPDYAASLEALCGVRPAFGCGRNALLIPRAAADKPLPTFDAHLVRMLEDQCRQQLERRKQGGLTGQVRAQLLGPSGLVADIEEVAAAMAMSARSLRRKLDAEGTTFRQIVEGERRQLAEQLLRGTQMTLDEMAIQLGYSDTASFTRAFRRWQAVAPGEYRRRALGERDGVVQ
ncbi:MAG: AraC family transcriptional regulator [Sinimarinibacterium flocculans]|uniref:AraC family transcriptional regulator n=1 Tax=Sinimarinibacterium flocculans TaxID=985250 RepID=UPI003C6A41E2